MDSSCLRVAAILLAIAAAPAGAQTIVYQCGNRFSDRPCSTLPQRDQAPAVPHLALSEVPAPTWSPSPGDLYPQQGYYYWRHHGGRHGRGGQYGSHHGGRR